jgi:hypothetical protein
MKVVTKVSYFSQSVSLSFTTTSTTATALNLPPPKNGTYITIVTFSMQIEAYLHHRVSLQHIKSESSLFHL